MRQALIALLLGFSPAFAADCPQIPETVTLKVDSIRVDPLMGEIGGLVDVTVSGFPPGQWIVKCAVRDKDGTYLDSQTEYHDKTAPIVGPAFTMTMQVDRTKIRSIGGADCLALVKKDY
jgi:hypothetical protein